MEKIIQINYQGRNISMEDNAYTIFQQYENDLKSYFTKEEGGEETFSDLQYRMAELLEEKTNAGTRSVTRIDIEEIMQSIGKPSDLEEEETKSKEATHDFYKNNPSAKKKLYRNKRKGEKLIAGVCSGIANYFSIDPIAVRLVFILFTIFNIATFFSFNLGILAYVVLWIILEPREINDTVTRKLFRNPKDKILGGVSSGLAQFFNTETWIVRLLFIAPFVIGIATEHSTFNPLDSNIVSSFFYSFSFISYIILWVLVPLAKSSTDYMLLKGEPINIATIQNPMSMQEVSKSSGGGINSLLKVIAYILIGFFLLIMIPIAGSLLIGSIFSYRLADIVLFSSVSKTLALFTILFFVALPLVALIVWLIRRLFGFKAGSKPLRIGFIALHTLGWVSAILLVARLVNENNTFVSKAETIQIAGNTSDTLFVKPISAEADENEKVWFEFNQLGRLLEKSNGQNHIKAIRLKYAESPDSNYRIEVERSSFGKNRKVANENAAISIYEPSVIGNILYLPSALSISERIPYHFQNIKVTIYVPKSKTLIISDELKRQLQHSIRTSNRHFYYSNQYKDANNLDEIVYFDSKGGWSKEDEDEDIIRIQDGKNAQDSLEVARELEDAKRELENAKREAALEVENAKREKELEIIEANRKFEDAKREAERKIQEANR